jgi:Zn-dependent protease
MSPQILTIIIQLVVLLFAISLHEAAHAWMASRLGDQTARMLGRVTLNPIKHIDPIGTILFPLLLAFTHFPVFGWARPTPVNTRNFKHIVRDDTLTTLAGPVSNVIAAIVALTVLFVIKISGPVGFQSAGAAVYRVLAGSGASTPSFLFPLSLLLCYAVLINLILAVFNLLPVPPLDGGHIVRNFLPYRAVAIYDRLGLISLFLIFFFGGGILGRITYPAIAFCFRLLGF